MDRFEINPYLFSDNLAHYRLWLAWNDISPELQFCLYAEWIAGQMKTERDNITVLETGMGQGFVTRRVLFALESGDVYYAYDMEPRWKEMITEEVVFS